MRMMLLTAGTRGDVEPFAALARYATAQGHQVRLGVPDESGAPLAGVDAVGLDADFRALLPEPGSTPWQLARHVAAELRPALRRMFAAAVRETVAFAPDLIVHHPLILTAPMVADALGVPRVLAEFAPVATATASFPAAGGPTATRELGRYTRATYAVPRAGARLFALDADRAAAQLPGRHRFSSRTRSSATLMAVSPQLLQRPDDWSGRVHLTGHWREEASTSTPVDSGLTDFLRDGRYLVASFGSMTAGDARARARTVIDAARARGLRALLLTGWNGLAAPDGDRPADVLVRRSVPLDDVLPGADVAIHHGGAGTVHAVARAGIPSVVVPFTADQPFWAAQLHRRGLAPPPIPARLLTSDTLVPALADAVERRERAQQIGRLIRQENGVQAALDVLTALRPEPNP